MLQSLADLRASLRARGSELLVLRDKPERGLPALLARAVAGASPATTSLVLTQTEPATEEAKVEAAVETALAALPGTHLLRRVWGRRVGSTGLCAEASH